MRGVGVFRCVIPENSEDQWLITEPKRPSFEKPVCAIQLNTEVRSKNHGSKKAIGANRGEY